MKKITFTEKIPVDRLNIRYTRRYTGHEDDVNRFRRLHVVIYTTKNLNQLEEEKSL